MENSGLTYLDTLEMSLNYMTNKERKHLINCKMAKKIQHHL